MTRTAALFPGQGAFFADSLSVIRTMGASAQSSLSVIEYVALRRLGRSLLSLMSDGRCDTNHCIKSDPALLQLAIFAISIAAYRELESRGVRPDVLLGHSFGEIAALTCADAMSIEQGAEIVCDRTQVLEATAPRNGRMAALSAGPDTLKAMLTVWIEQHPGVEQTARIAIAVENHDQQTVVSGPEQELSAFVASCGGKLSAHWLNAPYGFHHPALAPAATAFATLLAKHTINFPRRPVYSPILGRYYRPSDDIREHLAQHFIMPVAFSTAIRQIQSDSVSAFIECGALDGLTKIVRRILGRRQAATFSTVMPSLVINDGMNAIVNHIKEVCAMNAPVPSVLFTDFEAFWKERSPVIMTLLRSEFLSFLLMQQQRVCWSPVEMSMAAPVAPSIPEPDIAKPAVPSTPAPEQQVGRDGDAPLVSRDKLFTSLVTVYADAMEYPPEVFTESVELEAELGIDSVKQTEIMGRVSEMYALPKLPANVRISDYKTMGQIVDLVFANQGKLAVTA
jgi:malonyl CoA-acyl carrier protein transacylase